MAECKARVGRGVITFQCDLQEGHKGPHRAVENPRSVTERERWERDERHEASGLGQFQGPAQTTAERYTEGATEPPQPPQPEGTAEEVADGADAQVIRSGERQDVEQQVAGMGRPVDLETIMSPGDQVRLFSVYEPLPEDIDPAAEHFWVLVGGHPKYALITRAQPEPTKQRPGDQPLSVPNDETYVQERMRAEEEQRARHDETPAEVHQAIDEDMRASMAVGIERYGTALQAWNGRDALRDAHEEARDLYVYLSQMMIARQADKERLVEVVKAAFMDDFGDVAGTGSVDQWQSAAEIAVGAILDQIGPVSEASGAP